MSGWLTLYWYMDTLKRAQPRFGPEWVFIRQDHWAGCGQVRGSELAIKTATIVAYDRQLTGRA